MDISLRNAQSDHCVLAELQHRMRNTLGTMRMVARRSAETSDNIEDYVAHLDGRLAALARVQSAAIRDPRGGIDLGRLVADELVSAGFSNSRQAGFGGPDVQLHPRAAEPFGLALHELLTNAIKYGALATSAGHVHIGWSVERAEDPSSESLILLWDEYCIPQKGTCQKAGFGTIVLKEMLPYTLQAKVQIELRVNGLRCEIILPLTQRVVATPVPDPAL